MENDLVYSHFQIEKLSNVQNLEDILDLLNKIDETFFRDYSEKRVALLNEQIMAVCDIIDSNLDCSNNLTKEELSFLYFSKSLCLDKLPDYSKKAEESADKNVLR